MSKTLYWLQCGACGGDSMGLLSMESPDIIEVVGLLDLEILHHPSLSNHSSDVHNNLLKAILSDKQQLDILCVEGSVIRGPGGTGMYNTFDGKPKKDILGALVRKAKIVIAVGTCASFGGIGANGEVEATGLQFLKKEKGGFLGAEFKTVVDLPVINLPGCPCHHEVLVGTLTALCMESPLPLNKYNAPVEWFNLLIHQGCVRNEYHEYRVEDADFGSRGCLFFHLGCRGPLAHGPCNKLLWNKRNSKTRVGIPCVGCTGPDFPREYAFFKTRNIAGIPIELPEDIDRAHYLAYKGMAAAAAPERLKKRLTWV